MTSRERFQKICSFERKMDPFMWSVATWDDTLERWAKEGLPLAQPVDWRKANEYLLGYQDQIEWLHCSGTLVGIKERGELRWISAVDPLFEQKIVESCGDIVVELDYDGALVKRRKSQDISIPAYLRHPVTDRDSWLEYKKRLDPLSPGRWKPGWDIITADKLSFPPRLGQEGQNYKERDFPVGMHLMSLYGCPRNYMGVENISLAIYDDPVLVEETIEHQSYMALEMAKKIFDSGMTLDFVWLWEDMCYKTGPLVSPGFVKRCMAPHYRKVVDYLRNNGVTALILDCDGNVNELMPIWVDCGINATYPMECAAGMDARDLRRKFGRSLILLGNIDKRTLAGNQAEIDRELEKAKELLAYGGYFPNVDHHIPPDVPYANIVYFLNEIRKLGIDPDYRKYIPMP